MDEPLRLVVEGLFGESPDFDRFDWQAFQPGVEIHRLYGNATNGPSAALLRYQPGARIPTHEHTGFEHILVLRGSQQDEHQRYDTGTLLINGRGSGHTIHSEQGCVVLAIWERPVYLHPKQ